MFFAVLGIYTDLYLKDAESGSFCVLKKEIPAQSLFKYPPPDTQCVRGERDFFKVLFCDGMLWHCS